MTLPNFLVIGAAKSGTTTLYHWLRQHPDVFLPDFKEPFYFSKYRPSKQTIRTLEDYEALFAGAEAQPRIGEASAGYLYCEVAPYRIHDTLGPDVKLIAVLRHPVERAYSMYWHRRRDAEEELDFEAAVRAEPERIASGWQIGWHYLAGGRYREQLERYRSCFAPKQLLVLAFEDLHRDPLGSLREITDFLDLSPFPALPTAENENRNFEIRFPGIEQFIRSSRLGGAFPLRKLMPRTLRQAAKDTIRRMNRKADGYPSLSPELRRRLTLEYRDDLEYLAREERGAFQAWREDIHG